MAPTEVLARQHMENLTKLKEQYELPIRPVLLTGSVKGKARKDVYEKIASGEADITPLNGGALVLSFENFGNVEPQSHRYDLEWDPEARWITYTDLGTGYQPVLKEMHGRQRTGTVREMEEQEMANLIVYYSLSFLY